MKKFFEVIPSDTTFDFVGARWRFIWLSILLIVLSIGAMGYNAVTRGSVLNFGIDFSGGSQVRLALSKGADVDIGGIRQALEELGYEGSSAVTVPDAENEVLIRVKDVVSIDDDQIGACRDAAGSIEGVKLLSFNHPLEGSKIFLKYDKPADFETVQARLTAAGCTGRADKGFGKPDEHVVEYALIGIGSKLQEQLDERFGAGTVDHIVRSETVGAKVGNQLKIDGAVSMLYAIGFIFLYVMVRFDLRFAPGGIIALAHDAFLVVGAFALTWKEFNLQIVAAVLTVIGYSINDTIVVFDRVRERVALHRDEPLEKTTNAALNDTLSRTILTSGTTLIVVLAIFLLGSGPIKDFAFALIIGLVVGTYSSLYIATPVFLWVNRRFYRGVGHLKWTEQEGGAGPVLAAEGQAVDEGTGKTVGEIRAEDRHPGAGDADEGDDAGEDDGDEIKKLARRRRRPRP